MHHYQAIIGKAKPQASMAERHAVLLPDRERASRWSQTEKRSHMSNVTKARAIVARQRELIAEIGASGGECGKAEDLLSVFERSLAIFEDDLAAMSKAPSPASWGLVRGFAVAVAQAR